MANLKQMINDFVDNEFSTTSKKEQSLLKVLSLKKIFSLPYYKDMYYATSIGIKKDNTAVFATNHYELGDGDYFAVMHNTFDKYLDYSDFDDLKKHLVEPAIVSRLERFLFIAKNYSHTLNEYSNKIIEAHKGDNEFLSTLNSFKHIIPEYKELFFNDIVNRSLWSKGIESITSYLCKNETYTSYSGGDSFDLEYIDKKWLSEKEKRDTSILKSESLFENIDNYYQKYIEKIIKIEQYIEKEKPYLFKTPLKQLIEFSYFETKGEINDDGHSDFVLQNNLGVSPDVLKNNGISISDVYKLEPKKEKYGYQTLQETVIKHMLKKEDDISEILPSRFYGLDFLNASSLKPSSNSTSYIIAKANDDIVGFLSFNSTDTEGTSVIKNIGYVCIKDNFRGTGLVEKIYEKLACICVDNGNIIVNSHYTEQGREKLPRLKQRIREKYSDFLMIDTDLGSWKNIEPEQYHLMNSIKNFNEYFRSNLLIQQRDNPESLKNNIKSITKLHRDSMNYINNHKRAFSHDDFGIINIVRERLNKKQKEKLNSLTSTSNIRYKI